jgi:hypothetical protein
MSFNLGGVFKIVAPLALAAFTGGASLAVMAQQMATRALVTQLVQFAAQQLGVPPQMLQAALGAAGMAGGGSTDWMSLLQENGASATQLGELARGFQSAVSQGQDALGTVLQDQLNSLNRDASTKKGKADMAAIMAGKGSILMKLAVVLGMIADQKMNDMAKKAQDIGAMGEIKGGNQAKFTQMNAELQALGQELNVVSQGLSNVLKSIGEASSTIARKG